tara:strand:+ start:826 stop:1398 length:573 start_codon:yes stop_codon:yes gene_type:complete
MSELSDQEAQTLLSRISNGESDALSKLYDRLVGPLYSQALKILSNRAEAEEVIQDVFLSIWKNASQFDIKQAKPFTWISMITRNRCIDKIRQSKRRIPSAEARVEPDETPIDVPDASTAADKLQTDERDRQIRLAIDQLPADQRTAIRLAFFKGMTHIQIAKSQRISLGTAKSRIRYGFEKLSKHLSQIH